MKEKIAKKCLFFGGPSIVYVFLGIFLFLLLIALPILASSATSPANLVFSAKTQSTITLPIYKSGLIKLNIQPKRISIGNSAIADIVILRSKQVYIVGKSLGSTNAVFWDQNDKIFASVEIEVTHDLESLKSKIFDLLPGERIGVYSAQEKIILNGQVSSAINLNAAVKLADGYLSKCSTDKLSEKMNCSTGEIINLMTVGGAQQVMLEVKVAEMSRSFIRKLDADLNILNFGGSTRLGAVNGGASWPNAITATGAEVPIAGTGALNGINETIGPVVNVFQPAVQSIADKGLFLSHLSGNNLFQVALEISRSKGLSKILAEPTLTTLTGQTAEFLSGGEYPVPVPDDKGTRIQFKEYGVGVKFLPTILDEGRINLKLDISVSEISSSNSVTVSADGTSQVVVVPSLNKRSALSTVELADGQTIGIAGLIQDNVSEVVSKLPGLGDIPILGALFRSQEFISGQSELVIFVTPHLAKPIAEKDIRLPTDSFIPPNDLEFYLLGKMEGKEKSKSNTNPVNHTSLGGFEGARFGHQL